METEEILNTKQISPHLPALATSGQGREHKRHQVGILSFAISSVSFLIPSCVFLSCLAYSWQYLLSLN